MRANIPYFMKNKDWYYFDENGEAWFIEWKLRTLSNVYMQCVFKSVFM